MARIKSKRSKVMAKFAVMKKMIKPNDSRIKPSQAQINRLKKKEEEKIKAVTAPKTSSVMFLEYNTQLGPPYHIIVDTNFINFSIKYKLDIFQSMMDCMYAKCIPYISDCVIGELEKLGSKYNVALKICKDPRFERLPCMHRGTYADDCILERVRQHKCFIVATNDVVLKRRVRKIPGIPIMYIARHKFTIERMPEAYGAPRS